jgi:hypothetical protein
MDLASAKLLPRIWYHYIDDIFAVIKKTDVQNTLNMLNSQYNTIKFTIGEKCDQKLPFLDICVRSKSNAFKFTIHRKPPSKNRYIKLSSFHVLLQKYAAFHSTANRLINVPMTEKDYQTEKNNIIQIGQLNGIENSSNYKIKNHFETTKTKIPEFERSGIYQISCKTQKCGYKYIRQSRRQIQTRFIEHEPSKTRNNKNSAVALHMRTKDGAKRTYLHNFKLDALEPIVIHRDMSGKLLNLDRCLLESELCCNFFCFFDQSKLEFFCFT